MTNAQAAYDKAVANLKFAALLVLHEDGSDYLPILQDAVNDHDEAFNNLYHHKQTLAALNERGNQ